MRVVHELEQLGWVTRAADPSDSRAKLVEFTSAGVQMMEQLTASTEVVWNQYAKLVGAKQLRHTLDALRELVTASQEEGEI
jgi:MarR family transcriptional regulator for hemolysin